jgi:hypothetical protein
VAIRKSTYNQWGTTAFWENCHVVCYFPAPHYMTYFLSLSCKVYLTIFSAFVRQMTDEHWCTNYFQQDWARYHISNASLIKLRAFWRQDYLKRPLVDNVPRFLPMGPTEGKDHYKQYY